MERQAEHGNACMHVHVHPPPPPPPVDTVHRPSRCKLYDRNDTKRSIAIHTPSNLKADQAVTIILRPYVGNASVVVRFGQIATAESILKTVARRRLQDKRLALLYTW